MNTDDPRYNELKLFVELKYNLSLDQTNWVRNLPEEVVSNAFNTVYPLGTQSLFMAKVCRLRISMIMCRRTNDRKALNAIKEALIDYELNHI